MAEDSDKQDFLRRNEALGALVHRDTAILKPTGFSPIR